MKENIPGSTVAVHLLVRHIANAPDCSLLTSDGIQPFTLFFFTCLHQLDFYRYMYGIDVHFQRTHAHARMPCTWGAHCDSI